MNKTKNDLPCWYLHMRSCLSCKSYLRHKYHLKISKLNSQSSKKDILYDIYIWKMTWKERTFMLKAPFYYSDYSKWWIMTFLWSHSKFVATFHILFNGTWQKLNSKHTRSETDALNKNHVVCIYCLKNGFRVVWSL